MSFVVNQESPKGVFTPMSVRAEDRLNKAADAKDELFTWYRSTETELSRATPHSQKVQQDFDLLCREIEELTLFEEGWDEDNAHAIDNKMIVRAQTFVRHLDEALRGAAFEPLWMPTIGATLEGGVEIYWSRPNEQQAITFLPEVTSLLYRRNTPASKINQTVSLEEAHQKAVTALRSA